MLCDKDIVFQSQTPLGFNVSVSRMRWELIAEVKHPVMKERVKDVQITIEHPDEIRLSRSDQTVYLFYKLERIGRLVCVVTKRCNGDGFLITAYPTNAIKQGVRVWPT